MDDEMASWKSTGTYVDAVPPSRANIVDGMCIFRLKRPPGSLPAFKARYVARGFIHRQGVDYFHTFSPTPKMTTLRVLLHIAAQCDYELHSLDFSKNFLQGRLHKEIWLCRPPGFTNSFRPALGFAPSIADPTLFLRTDTSLPLFYVLVYVDDLVFATADPCEVGATEETHLHLPGSFSASARYLAPGRHRKVHWDVAKRVLCYLCSTSGMGRAWRTGPVVLTGDADASWVDDSATQRSSLGYTFSLGSGSVLWRSTRSSLVLRFTCEAEIYAGAMAA
ncbi:unnamed protein product [Closterium sp. NIES-53]